VFAVLEFAFGGGSLGSVMGEKIVRAADLSLATRRPLIILSSSGGARMQEGILSLMQMAKTSVALGKLAEEAIPFVSVVTHPTTGGVSASFAMQGDVIIAEPRALIGFAGPRVIQQTIGQDLPEGFQRSEFLLEHGMVDMVVSRKDLKEVLARVLRYFPYPKPSPAGGGEAGRPEKN
jgi:acetyl-CoA carboxylase carboxyl transferase subunit beta